MAMGTTRGIPTAREMIDLWHRDIGRTLGHFERGLIARDERDGRVARRLEQIDELRAEIAADETTVEPIG